MLTVSQVEESRRNQRLLEAASTLVQEAAHRVEATKPANPEQAFIAELLILLAQPTLVGTVNDKATGTVVKDFLGSRAVQNYKGRK
jgi:hypothetical protein